MVGKLNTYNITRNDSYVEAMKFIDGETGNPIDLTTYDEIKMDLRYSPQSGGRLLSSGFTFTIHGDDNNILLIENEETDWSSGKYHRDIKFIKGNLIETLLEGDVQVRENITI